MAAGMLCVVLVLAPLALMLIGHIVVIALFESCMLLLLICNLNDAT